MILHPGAHVGAGTDTGIKQVIQGLNEVLTRDTNLCIALETMAGKGSELGRNFEELARIYDGVTYNEKLRVCFDTCHTHDSGYDIIHDFDGVIENLTIFSGKIRLQSSTSTTARIFAAPLKTGTPISVLVRLALMPSLILSTTLILQMFQRF